MIKIVLMIGSDLKAKLGSFPHHFAFKARLFKNNFTKQYNRRSIFFVVRYISRGRALKTGVWYTKTYENYLFLPNSSFQSILSPDDLAPTGDWISTHHAMMVNFDTRIYTRRTYLSQTQTILTQHKYSKHTQRTTRRYQSSDILLWCTRHLYCQYS